MSQIALDISNLSKTYPNQFEALKSINLHVKQGDFFALLGPNGAGKSTTISIIATLVPKTAGEIRVFGYDLDQNPSEVKQLIGLVPQEFNFNVFEKVGNILVTQAGFYGIPRKIAHVRAEKYLKLLGLWEKRDEQSRLLSGGMKRRLMIARALMHEPKLLILDEPTAGVDIELRRSMWDFLRDLNVQGTTIILTTHYLEEAESLCRNIGIIDRGIIKENTDTKTLLSKLTKETLVCDLAQPIQALPKLDTPGLTLNWVDSTTIEIIKDQHITMNQVFTQLGALNLNITSLRNKTNRLEELFLHVVEKNLSNKEKSS